MMMRKVADTQKIGTQSWFDAYNNDTAVMNLRAFIRLGEINFSQFAVLAIADYQHAGIWKDKIPELDKVIHQMTEVNRGMGKSFEVKEGANCQSRPVLYSPVGLPDQLPPIEIDQWRHKD
jgi:hypothetical protein